MRFDFYYVEATRTKEAVKVRERGLPGCFIYNETERTEFIGRAGRILERRPEAQCAKYFPRSGDVIITERKNFHHNPLFMR